MATETRKTTDLRSIREWVESRGGKPARAKRTYHDEEPGALRIFPISTAATLLREYPGMSG
jgi:hypothetical protein